MLKLKLMSETQQILETVSLSSLMFQTFSNVKKSVVLGEPPGAPESHLEAATRATWVSPEWNWRSLAMASCPVRSSQPTFETHKNWRILWYENRRHVGKWSCTLSCLVSLVSLTSFENNWDNMSTGTPAHPQLLHRTEPKQPRRFRAMGGSLTKIWVRLMGLKDRFRWPVFSSRTVALVARNYRWSK